MYVQNCLKRITCNTMLDYFFDMRVLLVIVNAYMPKCL